MRRHRADLLIGLLTLVLLFVGLIVIYAVGPTRVNFMNVTYGSELNENYFFLHQGINVALSIGAFIAAYKFPYEKMRKFSKGVLILGWVLCTGLFILAKAGSGLAKCELGACRWINLGGFGSIQPAEILKLGLVLSLAQLMAERKAAGKINSSDFWIPAGVMSLISLGFVVVLQKDLGTGAVLGAIIIGMMFMSGVELKRFLMVLGGVAVLAVLAVVTSPHRMERVMTFMNGEGSDNYHIENALIAIGTGGLAGVGVGNSVQATGYLPESINDSVFAIMGETFGFIGLSAVVLVFGGLRVRILAVGERGKDDEQKLVAIGVFMWVGAQMAVNVMAMTGLIPLTGITLPLLSYGGTSMMFISLALGIVFQLSCYTTRKGQVVSRYSNRHLEKKRI